MIKPTIFKRTDKTLLLLIVLSYTGLGMYSMHFYYFWDCIELVSKQAHWFYLYDMNPLSIPIKNPHFSMLSTITHPPFTPYMTAVLWKIFGQHLWVSHLFVLGWAYIFIYNTWKLSEHLFKNSHVRYWAFALIALESTVLTQFAIASPDFILITGFVISLRGMFQQKNRLLAVGLIFLCCVNVRGIFVGGILFITHIFFQYKFNGRLNKDIILRTIFPYIPVFVILSIYFGYYLFVVKWSFWETGHASNTYTGYADIGRRVKHFFELGIRMFENGRFFLYLLCVILTVKMFRQQKSPAVQAGILFLLLLTGLYFFFTVFTKMPFLDRYFMPHYILSTLIVFLLLSESKAKRLSVGIIAGVAMLFQLTGHFWIYPDKIIKVWDSTLAHTSFYTLRKECFEYVDEQKLNYNEIAGGFCLFDDRGFIELKEKGKVVNQNFDTVSYFIYSNISPLTDEQIAEFNDKKLWKEVKVFRRGFVFIKLLKRTAYGANS